MTTPSPTEITNIPLGNIPWGIIVPVITALLGALGITLKLLLKGVHRRIDGAEKTLGRRIDGTERMLVKRIDDEARMLGKCIDEAIEKNQELSDAVDAKLEEKFQRVHELVAQLDGRVTKYFEAHERIRDKWDAFLTEYLKIDSTRGQKVDALFRLNDQMQKILDSLPRSVNSKIEEAFTHSLSELKLYIRELLAKEQSGV